MNQSELKAVLFKLETLHEKLCLVKGTVNRKSRAKAVREVEAEIGRYADSIPIEIRSAFDNDIGFNALNTQHIDDLPECISVVKRLIADK